MARLRNLKLPRGKLPEPLANALSLFGYNWEGLRSREGTLWRIYPYGKEKGPINVGSWTLHRDADPEEVIKWMQLRERGEWAPAGKLLAGDYKLASSIGV